MRDVLTTDRTYYVRPDGSDSNNGLTNTSNGAFQTIQYAVNWVAYHVDPRNFNVTIQLVPGTYSEDVVVPSHIGSKVLTILGTSTYGEVVTKHFSFIGSRRWKLKDLEINNSSGAYCVYVDKRGYVNLENVQFNSSSFSHIAVRQNSELAIIGNYRIVGNSARHLFIQTGAKVQSTNLVCTLVGTRTFSTYFAGVGINGMLRVTSTSYSGTATGVRYLSAANSVIVGTGGNTSLFPGDAAGSTQEGGIYA
jgi:pectin methylesterase-like acyl-CoA thioesterase